MASLDGKATPAWKKALQSSPYIEDFHNKVVQGWPIPQLVRYLQEDLQEFKDVPKARLLYWVSAYRDHVPKSEFVFDRPPDSVADTRLSVYQEKSAQKLLHGIDELVELQKLYELQLERIAIDFEREKENKKLSGSMTQEIRITKEILESSAKLKMDLGIDKRHLGVVETEQRLLKEVAAAIPEETAKQALDDPDSRRKLTNLHAAFQRLILTSEAQGTDLVEMITELQQDIPETP